jgi:hypothetical protein
MIFPNLKLESIVQVDDKTRLDGQESYITNDEAAITLIEIEPETAAGFIDVTEDKYLDYQYATSGDKTVSIRITTDGAPTTITKQIVVISEVDDKLFSKDSDLVTHEPDILEYVREGRNSFLDVHRMAQTRIVAWLDEHRIWKTDNSKLTKDDLTDLEEFSQWSKFLVLRYIYEGLSNATDDIFWEKRNRYMSLEEAARNRGALRLDRDGDGETDTTLVNMRSLNLVRR